MASWTREVDWALTVSVGLYYRQKAPLTVVLLCQLLGGGLIGGPPGDLHQLLDHLFGGHSSVYEQERLLQGLAGTHRRREEKGPPHIGRQAPSESAVRGVRLAAGACPP